MKELHCIVSGQVQGVAYRTFVQNMARELKLTGFVANLPDGSVEVLAQGDAGVLRVFEQHLKTGSQGSHVREIYDEWRDVETPLVGFESK